jgi:hypothetical protein
MGGRCTTDRRSSRTTGEVPDLVSLAGVAAAVPKRPCRGNLGEPCLLLWMSHRTSFMDRRTAVPSFLHLVPSSIRDRTGQASRLSSRMKRRRRDFVPDSFGKRNREKVKARKAEARDDRRIARNRRRKGLPPVTVGDGAMFDQVTADDSRPSEEAVPGP